MNIYDRQTEHLWREPIETAQNARNWQDPKPIAICFLLATHQHQRTDPQKHERIPGSNRVLPIRSGPKIRVIQRGQGSIYRREKSDAHERDEEKIPRTAKSRRQPREEVAQLKPIVRTSEEKDGNNRNLQWQPTRQPGRKPYARG